MGVFKGDTRNLGHGANSGLTALPSSFSQLVRLRSAVLPGLKLWGQESKNQ